MLLVGGNSSCAPPSHACTGARSNRRCLPAHTNILACIHTYTHVHMYIHTYLHTYIHTCIHAYMHTCIHAYMTDRHTCTTSFVYLLDCCCVGPWSCIIFPRSGIDLLRNSPPFSGTERRVMCEAQQSDGTLAQPRAFCSKRCCQAVGLDPIVSACFDRARFDSLRRSRRCQETQAKKLRWPHVIP